MCIFLRMATTVRHLINFSVRRFLYRVYIIQRSKDALHDIWRQKVKSMYLFNTLLMLYVRLLCVHSDSDIFIHIWAIQ